MRSFPTILTLLSLAAAPLVAQRGELSPAAANHLPAALAAGGGSPFRAPIHTAPDDPAGGAYGIWAAGDDFKVSFHGDMTFVPYLGRQCPRSQSLSWRTLEVRVGEQLLVDATHAPVRAHTDWRYEYHFGAVTEAYDVRPEGLEQSFVVHRPPGFAGDLLVRGRVSSTLAAPAATAAHQAITFADDQGRQRIRYGAATALDAAGRAAAITTSFVNGEVVLRVPASWLAQASYPVTIDPLLTPVTLATGIAPAESTDLVRDDEGNQLLAVFVRYVSASDADAWGRLYPDGFGAGGVGTPVFNDITASWSTPAVSCASVGPEDTLVIAMNREFPAAGSGIRVWAQPNSTAAVVTTVLFGPYAAAVNNSLPEVGGIEPYDEQGLPAVGSHALVVFQRDAGGAGTNSAESEVWGLLVDCSTSPATLGAAFEIGSAAASLDAEHPDVTKVSEGEVGSDEPAWIVVYQEYTNSAAGDDDWDVRGRRVDSSGNIASSFLTTDNSGEHRIEPKVAGQRGRYAVFYGRVDEPAGLTKISGYEAQEVFCERFDWPDGGAVTNHAANLIATAAGLARDFRIDDCAYDSDTDTFWVGAWREPGGSGEIHCTRVGYHGAAVETVTVAPLPDLVDLACDYDDDGNRYVMLYGTDAAASTNPVIGTVFTHPTEVAPSITGASCGVGVLTWQAIDQDGTLIGPNNQQIGHAFTQVDVNGVPPGAPMWLMLSFGSVTVPVLDPAVAPGCFLLVDNLLPAYIGITDMRFGPHTVWRIPLPEFLDDATIYFQVWYFGPAAGLFFSTARLEVPIVK